MLLLETKLEESMQGLQRLLYLLLKLLRWYLL
jgi:hypothetical protein